MKKIFSYFSIIMLLASCGDSNTTAPVVIKNTYSVEVPSFLSKSKDLSEDASLQYQNLFKEFYVIVIDEPIDSVHSLIENAEMADVYPTSLQGFTQLNLEHFESVVAAFSKIEPRDTIINGLNAMKMTVAGEVDGVDVFYALAFIEGKENYYQVMAWTLQNKEEKYADAMDKMIDSFQEI